jgi:precorrin-6B C5,15-methyltransferase / cobalt-precorrin-6B C5,C15-methyltransferase
VPPRRRTRIMGDPWLAIIGLGEDGLAGLTDASRDALAGAEFVFGGPRHLALVGAGGRGQAWPVPFDVGPVLALRGSKVAILASGDPFWYGAGGSLAAHLDPSEWRCFPVASTFSLAAARLGWRIEDVACLGLHAAPLSRLLPHLAVGQRAICLMRDGAAARLLADWLVAQGHGAARLWLMEALGGPSERVRQVTADSVGFADISALVAVAVEPVGVVRAGLPMTPGLPDASFASDGQITKSPIRALTLAALAPRPGEMLWDIGAGSGSVSVEWCRAGGRAISVEARPDRVANIRANVDSFRLGGQMMVVEGVVPAALAGLAAPDAIFVGGGASDALFRQLWDALPSGGRMVCNGVTLETGALLADWHAAKGGSLLRIDLAQAAPLGRMRGWQASRPVVQWSVVK